MGSTSNSRILLVKLPAEDPLGAWNGMVQQLGTAGNIEGALSYFSTGTADIYREAFNAIPIAELMQMINGIGPISAMSIENDTAQYFFGQQVYGLDLAFPIEFIRENGAWKIVEF